MKQLRKAGHSINVIGRDLTKARKLAEQYGAISDARVAGESNVVIVATPYADAVTALRALPLQDSQIVLDITNPLTQDYMGLTIGHDTSAAEEIASALPKARVVKAFNTLFAQVISDGADFGNGQGVPTYIAGDDKEAKNAAAQLAQSIGFVPVDAGGLRNARYLEPLAGLNIYFGYGAGQGTNIAPAWLRRA